MSVHVQGLLGLVPELEPDDLLAGFKEHGVERERQDRVAECLGGVLVADVGAILKSRRLLKHKPNPDPA